MPKKSERTKKEANIKKANNKGKPFSSNSSTSSSSLTFHPESRPKKRKSPKSLRRRFCCCCFPKMSHFRHPRNSDDEIGEAEERMQKNTFTNWINHQLEAHSSSGQIREDLFEEMRDGVLLCHLLEVLTGDYLPITTTAAGTGNGNAENGCSASISRAVAKVPRIYQLNNLSTALKCLRARGMELVNNNVTDLADGNPRIWLGLIWQIVLHFQVETGLTLIRQSAWHTLHSERQRAEIEEEMMHVDEPSTSKNSHRPFRRHISPQKITKSLPTTPMRKESAEQALLKWLSQEAIRPRELGFPWPTVPDLDRSWRNGRLLLALVHRFAPALVRQDELFAGGDEPEECRQRIQNALQLARLHLGIQPLIDPTDLCAPGLVPCRRSICTHVSQFLRLSRPPLLHPDQLVEAEGESIQIGIPIGQQSEVEELALLPSSVEPFRNWLHWLHKMSRENRLKLVERQRITHRQFRWFRQSVRKEWLERRQIVIEQIIPRLEAEGQQEIDQMVKNELDLVESNINNWKTTLHGLFAENTDLIVVDKWLTGAEHLLAQTMPIQTDALKIDETLEKLERDIHKFEEYFTELPEHRSRIANWLDQCRQSQSAEHSSIDEDALIQPIHLVEDLAERIDLVAKKQRMAQREMMFQQARFRILEYLSRLKTKHRIWMQRITNLSITIESLEEYKEMAIGEKPVQRMETLLDSLRKAEIQQEEEKDGEAKMMEEITSKQTILAKLSLEVNLELRKFVRIEFILRDLAQLWAEFEEKETNLKTQNEQWKELLEEMEILAGEMDEAGGKIAGQAARKRIHELRQKFSETIRKENLDLEILMERDGDNVDGGNKLKEWMENCDKFIKIRPKNSEQCAGLMESLNELRRSIASINDEIFGIYSPSNMPPNLLEMHQKFEEMRNQLEIHLGALAKLGPRFAYLERQLLELDQWTRHHDPDSRLATLSIVQRAGLVDWAGQELAELAKMDEGRAFDFGQMNEILQGILQRFKLIEIRRIEVEIELIETKTMVTQRRRLRSRNKAAWPQKRCSGQSATDEMEKVENVESEEEIQMKEEFIQQNANLEEKLKELEEMREKGIGEDETIGRSIICLRGRLEKAGQEFKQTGPSSTQKIDIWALLKRQRTLLAREEESEEEARATLNEMELIQQELKGNSEFEKHLPEWELKRQIVERALRMNVELKRILTGIERAKDEPKEWPKLEEGLKNLAKELEQIPAEQRLPMERNMAERIENGKMELAKKMTEMRRNQREKLRTKMDALKLTPEADLGLALQIVEEVVLEATKILQSVNTNIREEQKLLDEANYLEKNLKNKMETLEALRQLGEDVRILAKQNDQWKVVNSAQIEPILERLAEALRILNGPLTGKCAQLEEELAKSKGTFMRGEWDGARQMLRGTQAQIGALREHFEQKQVFLLKLSAFKLLVDKCQNIFDQIGTVQSANEGQKMQIQLDEHRNRILDSASEVLEAKTKAGMDVPDASVEKMIEQLEFGGHRPEQSTSSSPSISDRLEQFLSRSAELNAQFRIPFPHFNAQTISPAMFLEQISQTIHTENNSLAQIEKLANGLNGQIPQPNTMADTCRLLHALMAQRGKEMQERIRQMLAKCTNCFTNRLAQAEAEMASAMERRDLEWVGRQKDQFFPEFKKEWQLFHSAIRQNEFIKERSQWSREWIKQMDKLNECIGQFNVRLDAIWEALSGNERKKPDKKEQKWVANLESFSKWLEMVEKEIAHLKSNGGEMEWAQRQARLVQLRDNCLQHFRLVAKLQTHDFGNPSQAKLAKAQCQQYQRIMEEFEQMQLPSTHLIPIRREKVDMIAEQSDKMDIESTDSGAAPMASQTSLTSVGSNGSPGPSDLDSDLASVHSDVMINEALALLDQPTSSTSTNPLETAQIESGIIHELAASLDVENTTKELPLTRIEEELARGKMAIDRLHARYYTPKPLEQAQADANALKILATQITEQKDDLHLLLNSTQDEGQKQRLQRLIAGLKREKNSLKRFHKALGAEMEDELALRANYGQITERLNELEQEVRDAAQSERSPRTEKLLAGLELQIELLKKQCRAPRKYVEMSVDGTKSNSPTRRKRIILRLSNNVTTIIRVIEDKWRKEKEMEAKLKKSGKKKRRTGSESDAEFLDLHKKLTTLKQETESEVEIEPKIGEKSMEEEEEIMEIMPGPSTSTTGTEPKIFEEESTMKMPKETTNQEGKNGEKEKQIQAQIEQIKLVLSKSGEMKEMLEAILAQSEQMPLGEMQQFDQQIQMIGGVREELLHLQTEMEGMKADSREESAEMLEQKIKLAELVEGFGTLDGKFQKNLEEFERNKEEWTQINEKLTKSIKNGEQLLANPEATLAQLNEGIEESNEISQQIGQILTNSTIPSNVMSEMKLGLKQLKLITDMLAREYSKSMETKALMEEIPILLDTIKESETEFEGILSTEQIQQEGIIQAIKLLEKIEPETQKLRTNVEKLSQLNVELPILNEANEKMEKMNKIKETIEKKIEEKEAELKAIQKGEWPKIVTEVNVDVVLIRREREESEGMPENVERIVLNIPKKRRDEKMKMKEMEEKNRIKEEEKKKMMEMEEKNRIKEEEKKMMMEMEEKNIIKEEEKKKMMEMEEKNIIKEEEKKMMKEMEEKNRIKEEEKKMMKEMEEKNIIKEEEKKMMKEMEEKNRIKEEEKKMMKEMEEKNRIKEEEKKMMKEMEEKNIIKEEEKKMMKEMEEKNRIKEEEKKKMMEMEEKNRIKEEEKKMMKEMEEKNRIKEEIKGINEMMIEMVAKAQNILNDPNSLPQIFQNEKAKMAKAIEDADKFVENNAKLAAELDPKETLKANIEEVKRIEEMMEKRCKNWEEFVRQRDLANAQMDTARKTLEEIVNAKPIPELAKAEEMYEKLMESQNSLIALNGRLDGLQQLAEQMDPLEMAYSEVRFLDVDFEQLEREFEEELAGISAELEHEKEMTKGIEQMEKELEELERRQIPSQNLEALQMMEKGTIPELKAKLERLKKENEEAKKARKFVARAEKPSLEEMVKCLEKSEKMVAEMVEGIQKEKKDKFVQKIEEILQKAEMDIPPEEEIQKCSNEMQKQIPLTDPRAEKLIQRMEELKWKRKRKEAIQRKIDENLENIGQKIDELVEMAPTTTTLKKKRKKKKKTKQIEQKPKERNEQIDELKKAIENLENGILPTLNSLQNEAIQEGIPMEIGPEQIEQMNIANELVHNLKAELEKKIEEREKVNVLLKDLKQLNDETLATIDINEEEEIPKIFKIEMIEQRMNELNEMENKLKNGLEKMPSATSLELSQKEKQQKEEMEENAQKRIDRIQTMNNGLKKQMELLKEWQKERQNLEGKSSGLMEEIENRNLGQAEEELRKLNGLKGRALEAKDGMIRLKSWLLKNMPKNEGAAAELRPIEEEIEKVHLAIGEQRERLEQVVEKEKKLEAEKKALRAGLNELNEEAQKLHGKEEAKEKAIEMENLQKKLKELQKEMMELEQKCKDGQELSQIREQIDELAKLMEIEEVDVQKKLANLALKGEIERETNEVERNIRRAEQIDGNEQAVNEDLNTAIELLEEEVGPQLEKLQQIILKGDDEEMLNNAIQKQSELGQQFTILLQSMKDRKQALAQFNEETAKIEANLKMAMAKKKEAKNAKDLEKLMEEIRKEKEKLIEIGKLTDSLKPMTWPEGKLQKLREFTEELATELVEKKEKVEVEEKQKMFETEFERQIEQLEKKKEEMEKILNKIENIEDLNEMKRQILNPLNEANSQLPPAPNDELERRKNELKNGIKNVELKLATKLDEAEKEKELIEKIDEKLANIEKEMDEQIQHGLKPFEKANEDYERLMGLSKELAEIPLEKLKQKKLREEKSQQIVPIRERMNNLLSTLNEELDEEKKLNCQNRMLEEELGKKKTEFAEIKPTTVEETNEINYEENLSQLAELKQSLPILKEMLEKLEANLKVDEPKRRMVKIDDGLENELKEEKKELAKLETEMNGMEESIKVRIKVEAMRPIVENLLLISQKTVEECSNPESLEKQENGLKMLEEIKLNLEKVMAEMPMANESASLRERGEKLLAELNAKIQELRQILGEKLAKAAQFMAIRMETIKELDELNKKLATDIKEGQNVEQLAELEGHSKKLEELSNKLKEMPERDLDEMKRKEFKEMKNELEKGKNTVDKTRQELKEQIAENELKQKLAQETTELNDALVKIVANAQNILNDPNSLPQTFQIEKAKMAKAIEDADKFVENNTKLATELDPKETLKANIEEVKRIEEMMEKRHKNWEEFIRQRDLANAQMDSARKTLEEIVTNKPFNELAKAGEMYEKLMESQNSLIALNGRLDGLQQLAEQMDPLEMAYSEVRFLDVDFEQLEREFEEELAGISAELEHEKEMTKGIEQMEKELEELERRQIPSQNLEALQMMEKGTIPELKAKLERLKKENEEAKKARKFVARAEKPSLEEMVKCLEKSEKMVAEMVEGIQKEKKDKFVQKIEEILQKAEMDIPPEEEIQKCSNEMQKQIPLTDPRAEKLIQRMEELKWKRKRKEAIQRKIDENLENIGQKIDELVEMAPTTTTLKKKRKKKKKTKQIEQKPKERNEQIDELKKAIENLENGILPTLNSLQNEAIQEGIPMEIGPEQIEQMNIANELVHNLKAELEKKIEEREKVNVLLKDLKQLNDETLATIDINEEEEIPKIFKIEMIEQRMNELNEMENKLKNGLEKMPSATSLELSQKEKQQKEEMEENAQKRIDRIQTMNNGLKKQMELLKEWQKERHNLEGKSSGLMEEIINVDEENRNLGQAEEELRKLNGLKGRALEAKDGMIRLKSWLLKNMPKNEGAAAELRPIEEEIEKVHLAIGEQRERLEQVVEKEKKLEAEKKALRAGLNELNEEAQKLHGKEEAKEKAIEMENLQKKLKELQKEMMELEQKCKDGQELSQIREQIDELAKLMEIEEVDVQKKLANLALKGEIERETNEVERNIRRAEQIDGNEQAVDEDLNTTIELLEEEVGPKLEKLQQIILKGDDEEMLNNAIQKQSELGQQFTILLQSMKDRKQALAQFNEETAKIEANLKMAMAKKKEAKNAKDLEKLMEEIRKEKEKLIEIGKLKDSLKPMTWPEGKLQKLREFTEELATELVEKKEKAEAEEKQKMLETEFERQIEELEKNKEEMEKILNKIENIEDLNEMKRQILNPLNEANSQLPPAPNDELERRKNELKNGIKNVELKLATKLDEAEKEKELIEKIDEKLANIEKEMDEQIQHGLKPFEKANEDYERLMGLSKELAEIPLEKLKQKKLREEKSQQIVPIRERMNNLLSTLNEELDEEKKLNCQNRMLEEELEKKKTEFAEIKPTTVEETNEINYEANLSQLAELKQSLPVLKERLEKLEAKLRMDEPKRRMVKIDDGLENELKEEKKELAKLETGMNGIEESIKVRIKVEAMRPIVENLLLISQKTVEECSNPESLEKQENGLKMLEEIKLNLEKVMAEMPMANESASLRERGEKLLAELNAKIQELRQILGEKLAKAAQFMAIRMETIKELDELNKKLATDIKEGQNVEQLAELEGHSKKLEELSNKLKEMPEGDLDEMKRKEFKEIINELEKGKHTVDKTRQKLKDQIAANELKQKLAQETTELNDALVKIVANAQNILNDPNSLPQTFQNEKTELAKAIEEADKFAENNAKLAAELDPTETLKANIGEVKRIEEIMEKRCKNWEEFVRQRDLANVQMDSARKTLEEIVNAKPILELTKAEEMYEKLMESQNSLIALNGRLDVLQQLAEQMDPLKMAYSEVRFLDVDFEQLEREFEEELAGISAELEHEKEMTKGIEQMEKELEELERRQIPSQNLEALQMMEKGTIPELKAKLERLKKENEEAKKARKFVARAEKPSLEEMVKCLEKSEKMVAEMVEGIQKEKKDKFVQKIEEILQKAEMDIPPEEEIQKCSNEMQKQIPLTDPRAEKLIQRMEELKWKRKRKEAIQRKIDENLENIGQKIDELVEMAPTTTTTLKKKRKKKKKTKQIEQKPKERNEQIDELKKAIQNLENGILPTLNSLQNEAIQEGIPMEIGPEQMEQMNIANELVHNLKAELEKKIDEREKVNVLLKDLKQLNDETLATININEEEEIPKIFKIEMIEQRMNELNEMENKLKNGLEKMPSATSLELSQKEKQQKEEMEENAQKRIDRIQTMNNGLKKQMELLKEWQKERHNLKGKSSGLMEEIINVDEENRNLGQAEEELRKLNGLKSRALEAKDGMIRLKSWLLQNMPKNEGAAAELRPIEEEIEKVHLAIGEQRERLEQVVEKEKKLEAEKKALRAGLNELNEEAQKLHGKEEAKEKAIEMENLQKKLKELQKEMMELEQKCKDGQELSQIREQIDELAKLMEIEEVDVQKKLANLALKGEIERETNEVERNIRRAEQIDGNEQAVDEDLNTTIELLEEEVGPKLEKLQQIILKGDDEEMLNNAIQKQSELGQQFTILLQSMKDRKQALAQFNEETAKIEANLKMAMAKKKEAKNAKDLEKLMEEIRKEKEKLIEIGKLTDSLKPMTWPEGKLQKLREFTEELATELVEKKEKVEVEEKQKMFETEFERQIEQLEKKKEEMEKILNKIENIEDLNEMKRQILNPLNEANSQLPPAPNDELERRKNELKNGIKNVELKLATKLDEAEKEKELIEKIDEKLANIEKEMDEQIQHGLKPFEKANEDYERLMGLSKELAEIPLEKLKQKKLREEKSQQIEPIREKMNNLLSTLNEELNEEKKLNCQNRMLEEELTKKKAKLAEIVAKETNYEENLSHLAELKQSLPILKEMLEKLEANLKVDESKRRMVKIDDGLENELKEEKKELAKLETEMNGMEESIKVRIKVEAMRPIVENLLLISQKTVEECSNPESLEKQENGLKMLEEIKLNLEKVMAEMPLANESASLREKGEKLLAELNSKIHELGQILGEKMAKAAQFMALRMETIKELDELNKKLAINMKKNQNVDNQMADLEGHSKKLEELANKLKEMPEGDLDEMKRKEFKEIINEMEKGKHTLDKTRQKLKEQIAENELKQKLAQETTELNDALVKIVANAQNILNDPNSLPQTFQIEKAKMAKAIEDADKFVENNTKLATELDPKETLKANIEEVKRIEEMMEKRCKNWEEFVRQRDLANVQMDSARKTLEGFNSLPKTDKIEDVIKELENIKVSESEQLSSIRKKLNSISNIANSLSPLAKVDEETRFLFVDLESLENEFEDLEKKIQAELSFGQQIGQILLEMNEKIAEFPNSIQNAVVGRNINQLDSLLTDSMELKKQLEQIDENIKKMNISSTFLDFNFHTQPISLLRQQIERIQHEIHSNIAELSEGPSTIEKGASTAPPGQDYDINAAAEIFAAVFPDREPTDVLREHGLASDLELEMEEESSGDESEAKSEFGEKDTNEGQGQQNEQQEEQNANQEQQAESPVPEDPMHAADGQQIENQRQLAQRARWRRVLRTALPLQAMLVLLLGAACLVPHCDDDYCCHLLNNFARSFDPQLDFVNGPPPF